RRRGGRHRGRDVRRQGGGDRRYRNRIPGADSPLHPRPPRRDPADRPDRTGADRHVGDSSAAHVRPARLSFPSALPPRTGALPPFRAGAPSGTQRLVDRLPLLTRQQLDQAEMSRAAAPVPSDRPEVVLSARDIVVHYPVKSSVLRRVTGQVHAVEGGSIELYRGETLAIVGESGCGKSTLSRVLAGLRKPTSGIVVYQGHPLNELTPAELRRVRRHIQIIFQDPYASLNPRRTIRQIIEEAWEIHASVLPRKQWAARVDELLNVVGLAPEHADRYPHQFSGGQQQRVGIARALAL